MSVKGDGLGASVSRPHGRRTGDALYDLRCHGCADMELAGSSAREGLYS